LAKEEIRRKRHQLRGSTVYNADQQHRDGIKETKGGMDGIHTSNSAIEATTAWLGEFGAALASGEASRIAALFAAESHWP
jgi:hypothetical protein